MLYTARQGGYVVTTPPTIDRNRCVCDLTKAYHLRSVLKLDASWIKHQKRFWLVLIACA